MPATHLGTLSRLPTQTCWGGTVFHFLASTTIASASTSPKPYRWLTGKREGSETPRSACQTLLSSSSILRPAGAGGAPTHGAHRPAQLTPQKYPRKTPGAACGGTLLAKRDIECSPLCPAPLVFQSAARRCTGREVLTSRCWTSLQVSRGLQGDRVTARQQGPQNRVKKGSFLSSCRTCSGYFHAHPLRGGCPSRGGAPQGCCVHGCCRDFSL